MEEKIMRRKWDINIQNNDNYHLILGENPDQYTTRTSPLGINYVADFIERFEETFKRKARIIEYGDGLSTLWFAKNFPDNEIVSVGSDKEWFDWMEEELKKIPNHNIKHVYHKASNLYTTERDEDREYTHTIDSFGQFDVIINDGAQREMIGDYILSNADKFISLGGIFIRHDYEMAILGNWVGLRDEIPEWCRDNMDLGYDGFTHTHPEYALVTTTGNGLAGNVMEYGGVWRKVDHQFKRKTDAEEKRLKEEARGKNI
jgi:hypothetical protein